MVTDFAADYKTDLEADHLPWQAIELWKVDSHPWTRVL